MIFAKDSMSIKRIQNKKEILDMNKTALSIPSRYLDILHTVHDPEIPVISLVDLGVVRQVKRLDNGVVEVTITPTYSGCPALDVMGEDIIAAFAEKGIEAQVKQVLAPAWTTDMITEAGRKALKDYGIAPPLDPTSDKRVLLGGERLIGCPHCGSKNTQLVSQFGSTACKAQFKCEDCQEPFDYFKCL